LEHIKLWLSTARAESPKAPAHPEAPLGFGQHLIYASESAVFFCDPWVIACSKESGPAKRLKPIPKDQSCHPKQRSNHLCDEFAEDADRDDRCRWQAELKEEARRPQTSSSRETPISPARLRDAVARRGCDQTARVIVIRISAAASSHLARTGRVSKLSGRFR